MCDFGRNDKERTLKTDNVMIFYTDLPPIDYNLMYLQESALTLKREKYAKSIRRKQIDSYMENIRNRLIAAEKEEER